MDSENPFAPMCRWALEQEVTEDLLACHRPSYAVRANGDVRRVFGDACLAEPSLRNTPPLFRITHPLSRGVLGDGKTITKPGRAQITFFR